MNKAILVIDDPMCCRNCPLARERIRRGGHVCSIGHLGEYLFVWVYEAVDMESETKPDWCPLKPVPKPFICFGDEDDFSAGYNECLDDILNA